MQARIIVLLIFTFIPGVILLIALEHDSSQSYPALLVPFLIGLTTIIYNLLTHVKFKLADNKIVFEKAFQNANVINLSRLISWNESGYNIRGHRRRILLIKFYEEEIRITNEDYKNEYEELIAYLEVFYSEMRD